MNPMGSASIVLCLARHTCAFPKPLESNEKGGPYDKDEQ